MSKVPISVPIFYYFLLYFLTTNEMASARSSQSDKPKQREAFSASSQPKSLFPFQLCLPFCFLTHFSLLHS